MTRMRRLLGRVAVVWLCAHVAMLSASVTLLAAQLVDDEATCTCADGNGVMCPMHHRRTPRPSPTHCAVQDASTPPALAVTNWLGVTGIVHRDLIVAIAPAPAALVACETERIPATRSSRPESPPPRAALA
jgi:hypothetical protein